MVTDEVFCSFGDLAVHPDEDPLSVERSPADCIPAAERLLREPVKSVKLLEHFRVDQSD